MKKTIAYLLRFTAGVFGLFVIMVYNKWWMTLYGITLYTREYVVLDQWKVVMSVLVQITIGVVSLYQIVRLGLYALTLGKNPKPKITRFLDSGIAASTTEIYRRRFSTAQQTVFSLSAWGVFILLFTLLLISMNFFANDEVFFLKTNYTRNYFMGRSTLKFPGLGAILNNKDGDPVRCLFFITEDNNPRKYFRDLYTIARDLKEAGAKVVVADMVDGSWMGNGSEFVRFSAASVEKIQSLNIVVWGLRTAPGIKRLYYSRNDSIRLRENSGITIRPVFSVFSSSRPTPLQQMIAEWHPLMKMRSTSNLDYNVDAAVEAAMKYYDIPDTSRIVSNGHTVSVGRISIHVSNDGAAYTNMAVMPYYFCPVLATRGLDGSEECGGRLDSLRYSAQFEQYQGGATSPERTVIKDLKGYREYFSGKVVVINWVNENSKSGLPERTSIATVISSLLRNTLYRKIDALTYLFMVVTIGLIALVSTRLNTGWIVGVSALLSAGVTAFAWWMLFSFRIVFDPLYPIAAAVVACVIFSLLRISRRTTKELLR